MIRFRRVGDSILALALIRTLKKNFPDAEIHYVLDESMAPLFEGHPDIDRLILFNKEEKHSLPKLLSKIWRVVHQNHYDAIIDMRSTVQTLWFSLFSLGTRFRIGRKKGYNALIQNYRLEIPKGIDMVRQDLMLAAPLNRIKPIADDPEFRIHVDSKRKQAFREYMQQQGIDFHRPIIVAAIATRIEGKEWDKERMKQSLQRIIDSYDAQIIFNYGGKREEEYANRLREEMGCDPHIHTDIRANSLMELAEMIANCDFFFGNEGGPRHLAHALGIPSFAIYPPNISKTTWLPANDGSQQGISPDDIRERQPEEDYTTRFQSVTVDEVWKRLSPMLDNYLKTKKQ